MIRETAIYSRMRRNIYRVKLFEIYDRLSGEKKTKALVRAMAQEAAATTLANNEKFLKTQLRLKPEDLSIRETEAAVMYKFPYKTTPADPAKRRNFTVAVVCTLTASVLSKKILEVSGERQRNPRNGN